MRLCRARLKVLANPLMTPVFWTAVFPPNALRLVEPWLMVLAARAAPVPLRHRRVVDAFPAVNGFHAAIRNRP